MHPSLILRSGRSAWKGPFFVAFPNIRDALANNTPIKTQARACTILPNFVGLRFLVHNGKDYVPVNVTQDMVGHKLGEFSHTKKRFVYKCAGLSVFSVLPGANARLLPGRRRTSRGIRRLLYHNRAFYNRISVGHQWRTPGRLDGHCHVRGLFPYGLRRGGQERLVAGRDSLLEWDCWIDTSERCCG
ncbi:hypothetical protein BC834DRAFT_819072 [Gloeopeniophorella convolvens]|nr:hypothetical protein BC834DRAFT_819072 [Gloeopeniophorella convolvens]